MKAALYCRLSEEDRGKLCETDDSNSIQNQKAMLTQYAAAQGWEVYRIYSDDDYTGSDRRRPEFTRLLEDARARRFDIVLCKTQSRFTRELELVEKYIHGLFPLWGIRFVSIVDNADTDNRGNKKSRQINGLVNEWYLEDMSENIRSVLTSRRQNGFHIGSSALYGYRKDPAQKGRLLIDEEAAAVVREVFSLYAQGCGKTAIARILNERGIPNPTEYKRQHGLLRCPPPGKCGTLWKYPAISSMLANEMYTGTMVQGRYGSVSYKTKQNRPRPKSDWYVVQGTHEAIISPDLWNRVQDLLRQRAKPCATGQLGLFSGKVRCKSCGYTLRSSKSHGRYYLQCTTRHASRDACPGAFLSVETLEHAVLASLHRLIDRYLDEESLRAALERAAPGVQQSERLQRDLNACAARISACGKRIRTLYRDKLNGLLQEEDFAALSKELSAERTQLERRSAGLQRQLDALSQPAHGGLSDGAHWERCLRPQKLTREMVDTLIDYIAVGRRAPGTRDIPIEIHWRF